MNDESIQMENKWLRISAHLLIIGSVIGPMTVFVAALIKPQPLWVDTATFIANYHWVQIISILFGFPLIIGFALFVASAYHMAEKNLRIPAMLALMLASVGSVLAVINYAMNAAYIPNNLFPDNPFIKAFSMVNPNSISWVFEMFAYAFLGTSTWLIAPIFSPGKKQSIISKLLVANGVVSIFTGMMAIINLSWVQSPVGLLSYVLWNVLIAAFSYFVLKEYRQTVLINHS